MKGAVLYNEVIDSIARNEMSNNPASGKEYIGEDGFLHCGICGEIRNDAGLCVIQQSDSELATLLG